MLSGTNPGAEPAEEAPTNSAPVSVSLTNTTVADDANNNSIVGILMVNDPDPGDTHTFTLVDNAGGRFSLIGRSLRVANSSLLDTQAATSHTILVQVTDSAGNQLSSPQELTITVTQADQPPVVVNPIADLQVNPGTPPVAIDLSNVFSDPEGLGLQLSIESNTNPFFINATLDGSTLNLRFGMGLNASGQITIRATDQQGQFVEDTFAISMNQTMNAPTVVNPIEDVNVPQGTTEVVIDLSDVFADVEDSVLDLRVFRNNNQDLVETSLVGTQLTLTFVQPDLLVFAEITIRATDSNGLSVDDRFSVETFELANNPPTVVNPVGEVVVDEDADDQVLDLSNVFADVEDNVLLLTVTGNTNQGLLTTSINGSDLTLGFLQNQFGSGEITIRATDSFGDFVEHTFTVTVNSVNDDPVVDNPVDDVEVDEDAPSTVIDLADVFSDLEGQGLTLTVSSSDPTLVDAQVVGTQLTLDYLTDANGVATITVRATDSEGGFVEHTFVVTVNSINDAPTVINEISDVNVNQNANDSQIDLSNVFADVEDANLILSIQSNTNTGLVNATLNGSSLNLDFVNGQNGTAQITVRATDADGDFVEETFEVTVKEKDGHQCKYWCRIRKIVTHVINRIREHLQNHHNGTHRLSYYHYAVLRMKLSYLHHLRRRLSWHR